MKKKCLILGGGGDMDISFQLDQKYFSLLPQYSRILYVPIALKKSNAEMYYDWFSKIVSNHRHEKEVDFSMLLEDEEIPNLNLFDSVYIGGGNTYKLLDYMYSSKFNNKLIEYINAGGIVYGGSAGAMVMAKDIRTVEEENDKGYKNYEGLNLLGGKSVFCHYVDSSDSAIFGIVKKIGSEVIAIPEDGGIILGPDKSVEVIGNIFVFDTDTKRKI